MSLPSDPLPVTRESPAAQARRIELCQAWRSLNYAEGYQKLHPQAQIAHQSAGGGFGVFVAPGSPLNNARGVGLSGPVSAADLQALEDFYASRGENLRLHVCPLADPSLLTLVRERGYRLRMFFSVLAKTIPVDYQPAPLPAGLRIAHAGPQDASLWLHLSGQGFESAEEPSPEAMDILGPNFHAPQSAALLAYVEDEPAGSGGAYFAPQVGALELGGASTLPRFRKRGVQRALIEARLALGPPRGCDLAVVLTEPGSDSQRNLLRAGFAVAYTKVVMEKGNY
jgi:GNAT superfamily N-acetyltransferase